MHGARLRIAIDASAARMGGGASRTVELAVTFRELAPQHEYVFAVSPTIAARLTEVPPRTRLMLVPQRLRSLAGRMAWEHLYLPSAFADAGADWVISPFNVLPLGPGLGRHAKQAVIVSNIGPFAPEIIASMHGYQAARNRLLRTLTLRSLERADHVFLLSGLARRLLEPRVDGKPVTALPMSPPTRHVLEAARSIRLPDAVAGVPFFVSVGEFFPYKGFEDAVRAIGLVRGSGHDVRLVLCGNPMDSAYASSLRDLAGAEAPGAVRFVKGAVQPQALALMASAVATVVSSRVENPGRVPVEAMTLGSPILAADTPSVRDSCGDAARYYPAGDHRRLAEHMSSLLSDAAAGDDLRARGRERVSGNEPLSATRTLIEALGLGS